MHLYDCADTIHNNYICPAQVGNTKQSRFPELLQEMISNVINLKVAHAW